MNGNIMKRFEDLPYRPCANNKNIHNISQHDEI